MMKVLIGSVLVLLLIGAGIWLMLSPSFKKVGETASKVKDNLKEGSHDGRSEKDE